jgi:hypothetical protein
MYGDTSVWQHQEGCTNLLTHNSDTVSHGVRTGNKPESKTFELPQKCYSIYTKCCNVVNSKYFNEIPGGPPAWGLGEGLTTPHCKIQLVMKCYTWPQN